MIKVVIIDDEPLARSVIRDYLSGYPDIDVVAECANGFEGLKAISAFAPDLVFLDIQMPKITGFEMLELIDNPPGVIFTTAFDDYAIRAFESNAIDYLLKPFSKDRFVKAFHKWMELRKSKDAGKSIKKLIDKENQVTEPVNRIVVKNGNEIRIIPTSDVFYIEAYDDYIKIHIRQDCFLKTQTLNKTELLLDPRQFVRAHRSYIINLNEITRIELIAKDSYEAILRDGARIPLSRTGYSRLKSKLSG